tara:strand:+ start:960 stop:1877 length:918 start_codon:yes stop_codon:yes gene_type:complete
MKKLGNPEQFDNESEQPETSWGQKFRNTRLVFRKKDGELEFHTYGGDHRPRTFISQIKRADKDVMFGDFDYVRLYTTDNNPGYDMVESSPEPVFSQCQIDESSYCCKDFKLKQFHPDLIICPDFQFSSWLSFDYESYVQKIRKSALDTPSIKKVCWRGLARPQHSNRALLCKMSNLYPDYIDAKHTGSNKNKNDYLAMDDMVSQYKYLIDTQAHGFSGRLKYLMNSNRLIFMQDRFYKTFIEEHLNPFEHYIPIKYNFSDLVEKIKWAEDNPKESEAINENMFEFCSSNLSVRAINKKWKELLND